MAAEPLRDRSTSFMVYGRSKGSSPSALVTLYETIDDRHPQIAQPVLRIDPQVKDPLWEKNTSN